jgi:transcriptional regulator with XRE-family HTH domain
MHWIKQRREELGISQAELARRMETEGAPVSTAAVSHWEVERYNPPLEDDDFRKALGRALKLNEAELLTRAGYKVATQHTAEAERAAHIIDRLPPDKRELAIRILEALN